MAPGLVLFITFGPLVDHGESEHIWVLDLSGWSFHKLCKYLITILADKFLLRVHINELCGVFSGPTVLTVCIVLSKGVVCPKKENHSVEYGHRPHTLVSQTSLPDQWVWSLFPQMQMNYFMVQERIH